MLRSCRGDDGRGHRDGARSPTMARGFSTATHLLWYPIAGLLRQAAQAEVPALTAAVAACRRAAACVTVAGRLIAAIGPWWLRRRRRRYASPEASRSDISARLRRAAERLGPDLHQARPDHLQRRGPVPAGAGQRVQAVPRPGAGRAVRDGAQGGRGRPRRAARGHLRRPSTARRSPPHRSPRCTRRRCAPARRSWSRCSGPASPGSCARTCG